MFIFKPVWMERIRKTVRDYKSGDDPFIVNVWEAKDMVDYIEQLEKEVTDVRRRLMNPSIPIASNNPPITIVYSDNTGCQHILDKTETTGGAVCLKCGATIPKKIR